MSDLKNNKFRVTECKNWEDFTLKVRREKVTNRIYRGHRDPDFKLSSTWERTIELVSSRIYLERFKENAIGIPGFRSEGLDDLDWWLLGRHYGLMTPYLDWTKSPYIAAFFAFSDLILSVMPTFTSGTMPHIVA